MADPRHADLDLYTNLIREIKVRLFAVDSILGGHGLPPQIVYESCALQLRLCCELLSLGCLVAHGDIDATKRQDIQKAYEPGKIISHLSGLHAGFFPIQIRYEMRPDAHFARDVPKAEANGAITQDGVIELWNKLGTSLHKGSAKKLWSGRIPDRKKFPAIDHAVLGFRQLLDQHRVASHDNSTHFVVLAHMMRQDIPVTGALSRAT